jgi:raffinose/stachyose/melibiose transport system permease protein
MNQALNAAAETAAIVRRRKFSIKKSLVWIILSVLFVTQIYPLLWLLTYSLKTNEEILSGSFFALPHKAQWNNYKDAFTSGHYVQYLGNSVLVTSISLICVVVLSAMAAYAITRFRWKYGQLVMLLFLLGLMIPLQATLLPLMLIFKNLHILNTRLALILPYIAFSTPISVFILNGFLKSVPREMEESALMDGAGVFRTFCSIILPLMVPPIMTVCILTFISNWNEYILASTFISSPSLKTLPFGVYGFVSQYQTNYGAIGAFLVMGAAPVVVLYFALSQKIAKGIAAGAVKG